MLLYSLLKTLFRPALRVFYDNSVVTGRHHLAEIGPLIVVANHPNTLLDPLLTGMLWRRELRFLTTSKFFAGAGGWVLRATGAIPIYRQADHSAADVADASILTGAQRLAHNDASFRAVHARLAAGEALLIFPEGTSEAARGLRPVKSGAARIALSAEARHGWQLGVCIVPVGLNYADAYRFRSLVTRCAGPPLRVADYRARYEANPPAAIRALSEDIRRALAAELAAVTPPEHDALLRGLERLAGAGAPAFARTRALSEAVGRLAARDPARLTVLRHRTYALHRALHRLGVAPDALTDAPGSAGRGLGRLLGLTLGAPVAAWGAANNALALGLPAVLLRRLRLEVEFGPSLLVVAGLVSVPLGYGLQTALVSWLTGSSALAAGYLVSLPISGAFALAHRRWWATATGRWALRRLARRRPRLLAALVAERTALLAEVEEGTGCA